MRRTRYYAYNRKGAGVAWKDKSEHDYLCRYPHQVPYFQLEGFTGKTKLMTKAEHRQAQRVGLELASQYRAPNAGVRGAMVDVHLEDPATGIVDTLEGWRQGLADEGLAEPAIEQRLAQLREVVWVDEPEPEGSAYN